MRQDLPRRPPNDAATLIPLAMFPAFQAIFFGSQVADYADSLVRDEARKPWCSGAVGEIEETGLGHARQEGAYCCDVCCRARQAVSIGWRKAKV
jgi:hypothetical protein